MFYRYQKLIALLVAGFMMFVLERFGVTPDDFSRYGLEVGEFQVATTEFIITYGLPAVFMVAAPMEKGVTIFRYWRWIVAGLAIVIALLALIMVI